MDRLEEHIKKNRHDFDIYEPSDKVWREIDRNVKRRKTVRMLYIPAAAIIVLAAGFSFAMYLSGNKLSERSSVDHDLFSGADRQLKETEIYYTNLVNDLWQQATPLLEQNPDAERELKNDMMHLDSICTYIKRDLKENIANREVIEALITNYRTRITILEEMLLVLAEESEPEQNPLNHAL